MPFLPNVSSPIYFEENGTGAPVIALHGSASTGSQWKSLTGCLEGRLRVLSPDLPGYGNTPAISGRGRFPALDEIAHHISAVADYCGEPVHLIGHSFGGAVALKLAMLFPQKVRSLTVIEPVLLSLLRTGNPEDEMLRRQLTGVADTLSSFAAEGDPWRGMGRFVDYWNGEGSWFRTSERLRRAIVPSVNQVLDDFTAIDTETSDVSDLAQITCPTLCIMGLSSRLVTMRTTELVAKSTPDARLEMVPDAGHMSPLTDPHVVDPMILRHLSQTDEASELRWPNELPLAEAA